MSESKWAVPKKNVAAAIAQMGVRHGETERLRVLNNSILNLRTEEEVVREVSKLWHEAQEKFLAIGRYLVRAKERFQGEYERVILPQLPFGRQVAFQLRTVASAVDGGKIEEEALPRSYSTAYSLVTLDERQFELAKTRNLVRPDVARSEIEAFRREFRLTAGTERIAALARERHRLVRDAERIKARMAEIDAELSAL